MRPPPIEPPRKPGRPRSVGLRMVNLRLREVDVAVARERAAALGIPYQHVIRLWVAEGANGVRKRADRETRA